MFSVGYVPLSERTNIKFSKAGRIIIFYALQFLAYCNTINRDGKVSDILVKTILNFNFD